MAATIKLKNSVTSSSSPSSLSQGEVALNITDKKLWVGNASSTPVQLLGDGAAASLTTLNGLTVGKGAGAVSTNTAVGASALATNSTGAQNTAVGINALKMATDSLNTAVGTNSLQTQSTGYRNTAVGAQSYPVLTTGIDNVAVGTYAGNATTTGSTNTAIGASALYSNTTANYNTAVGYQAGYSATGGSNTYLGTKAGYSITTGVGNVCVGRESGYSITTGSGNTFVGTGDPNSYYPSGYFVTTGSNNTILGAYNGNQGGLDIRTASNYIVLSDGAGNPRLYMTGAGEVNTLPTYNNTSASAANVGVGSTGFLYRSTSALKYKQDIRDVEDFDISALRPVRYKSKCENDDQTKDHLGLIADEAAEAGFEELVTRNEAGEVEGFQYERLTVVLLKELQTLKAKVSALENK